MKQKKLEMEQTNLESEKATCRKTQLGPRQVVMNLQVPENLKLYSTN